MRALPDGLPILNAHDCPRQFPVCGGFLAVTKRPLGWVDLPFHHIDIAEGEREVTSAARGLTNVESSLIEEAITLVGPKAHSLKMNVAEDLVEC